MKSKEALASAKPKTVDAYIAATPQPQRRALEKLRQTIKTAAPEAVEGVHYGMAGYKYKGKPVIYFARGKDHVALYGGFVDQYDELKADPQAKGTVRFQADRLPSDRLVRKIVKDRLAAIDAGP